MTLKQIDHICLLVSDIHKAKLYYEKIFGFKYNFVFKEYYKAEEGLQKDE